RHDDAGDGRRGARHGDTDQRGPSPHPDPADDIAALRDAAPDRSVRRGDSQAVHAGIAADDDDGVLRCGRQLEPIAAVAASADRYRVSNSNSAWHPPQTVMPDGLQIQFL